MKRRSSFNTPSVAGPRRKSLVAKRRIQHQHQRRRHFLMPLSEVLERRRVLSGFSILETDGETFVAEPATTDTFSVVLTAAPASNVVIDLDSDDLTEATISTDQLTFTPSNWNVAQVVIATAADDSDVDGDQNSRIRLSINDELSDDVFDALADQFVETLTQDDDGMDFGDAPSPYSDDYVVVRGNLDIAFGDQGVVNIDQFTTAFEEVEGIELQEDGKIITVGTSLGSQQVVRRLNTDGTVDTSFGTDGTVTLFSSGSRGIEILLDGKILVGGVTFDSGATHYQVARLNTDGSLDSTFGNSGIASIVVGAGSARLRELVVRPDGKIILGGYADDEAGFADFALAQFNPDGSIDNGFGAGGLTTTNFEPNGSQSEDRMEHFVLLEDGKIFASGSSASGGGLARYNADGTLDLSYSDDGLYASSIAHGFILQLSAGGFVIATPSTETSFAAFEYEENGLDLVTESGAIAIYIGGEQTERVQQIVETADGKIVVASWWLQNDRQARFIAARFLPNRLLDTSFADGGIFQLDTSTQDTASSLALQDDGKILVGGRSDGGNGSLLIRLDAERSGDASHVTVGPQFGMQRDAETGVATSEAADGDDNRNLNDEDGVSFGELQVGQVGSAQVTVQHAPNGAKLDAWIDFDGDGSWHTAAERIAANVDVREGVNHISFAVPHWAHSGNAIARFRISTEGGLAPRSAASDGEVEDYSVEIVPPAASRSEFSVPQKIADAVNPRYLRAVDLDQDGNQDLVVRLNDPEGSIQWFRNEGNGFFAVQTIATDLGGVDVGLPFDFGDIDSDGDIDMVFANREPSPTTLLINDGNQSFSKQTLTTRTTVDAKLADLDADGDLDVVVYASDLVWYRNDGGLQFTERVINADISASGFGTLSLADIDRDGDLDLGVTTASRNVPVELFLNEGLSFARVPVSTTDDPVYPILLKDFDQNGTTDILVSGSQLGWFSQEKKLRFAQNLFSQGPHSRIFAADFNGDGKLDVTTNFRTSSSRPIDIFRNDGQFNFESERLYSRAFGMEPVDLDGDGDLDIAAISFVDGEVVWLSNRSPGFAISKPSISILESGADTFEVSLADLPDNLVRVTLSVADPSVASVSAVSLDFTRDNWDAPQTITISGIDNDLVDGPKSTTLTLAIDDTVSDAAFRDLEDISVPVNVDDDEVPGFSVTESDGDTETSEDETTDTVTVVLTGRPQSDVVLAVASGDETETSVSAEMLTFTTDNWSTPQTVTLTGVDDLLLDGDQDLDITFSVVDAASDDFFDDLPNQTIQTTNRDNESLTLSIDRSPISENQETATVTLTRSNLDDLTSALVVTLGNSDSTELSVPDSVTIPANESAVTFPITSVDDAILDGTQSVTVSASAASYFGASLDLDVRDYETLALVIDETAISENGGTATATVTRSTVDELGAPLTVTIANSDDSEASTPVSVEIPANQASISFAIAAVDDDLLDGIQTVTLAATSGGFESIDARLDVLDYETVVLTVDRTTLREDGEVAKGRVTRSNTGDLSQLLAVQLASSDPSEATVPISVTIPAGEAFVDFDITAVDDALLDGTQSVAIDPNATGYFASGVELEIEDHEFLTLEFLKSELFENGQITQATITRSNTDDLGAALTVVVDNSDSTELSIPASLTIPANEASIVFEVSTVDDKVLDGDQKVTVEAAAEGFALAEVVVDVLDYETLTVAIDEVSVSEFGGTATGTVTRSTDDDQTAPLTVLVTSSDTSEATAPTVVTIPANSLSVSFPINAVDDNLLDGDQTVTVSAVSSGFIAVEDQIEILDYETLIVTLTASALREDDQVTSGRVKRSDTASLATPLTVQLSSDDETEATVPASVVIPAGRTFASFEIRSVDDALLDGTQVAHILGSAAGYIEVSAALEIEDHETLELEFKDDSLTENEQITTGRIRRSNVDDLAEPLTVELASDDTSEATVPMTVIIPSGQFEATFDVASVDDRLLDGPQTASVLASAEGYGSTARDIEISDHEVLEITFGQSAVSENGGTTTATVTRSDLDDLSSEVRVVLGNSDETEASIPTMLTIPAGLASATFEVEAVDDALLDGSQLVDVSGSSLGFVSALATIEILDVEALSLTADQMSISEFGGSTMVTLVRSDVDDLSQELVVSLTSDDASEASVPTSVIFPASSVSTTFIVDGVDDALLDGTQLANITASASGYDSGSATIEITDFETIGLALSEDQISEKGGTTVATISRSNIDDLSQLLELSLTSSDTSEATLPETVTILPGEATVDFLVEAQDDALLDGIQVVALEGMAPGFLPATVELNVEDHETIQIALDVTSISELDGAGMATISRSNSEDLGRALTVELESSDATEASVPTTVTIPRNATSTTFEIVAVDDQILDGSQQVSITANAQGYFGDSKSISVEDYETLTLVLDTAVMSEAGGLAMATLTRSTDDDLSQELVVALTNSDTSEVSMPESVVIPAGQASVSFEVVGVDDALLDGVQAVTLGATAAGFLAAEAAIEITDAESLTVELQPNSISEFEGFATVTVRRGDLDDLSTAITVQVLIGDETELAGPTSVTIPSGTDSQSFTVQAIDDSLLDGPQVVTLSLSSEGYTTATGSLEVEDHELLTLEIVEHTISENSGLTTAVVTRGSIDDLGEPLIVSLSSDDESEVSVPAMVTIPANAQSVEFEVVGVDDALLDGTQAAQILVEAGGFQSDMSTISVTDAEFLTLSVPPTVDENGVSVTGSISRSNNDNLEEPLLVSLTSSAFDRLEVPSSIEIPAGQASTDFTLQPRDNQLAEGAQRIAITAEATGYEGESQAIEVQDDETPELTLVLSVDSIVEGESLRGTVQRNTPADANLQVVITDTSGGRIIVPPMVTILAGAFSADFDIETDNDEIVLGDLVVEIDVAASEFGAGRAVLNLTEDDSWTWHNVNSPFDVNDDGFISSIDALLTINFINNQSNSELPPLTERPDHFIDVSNDGFATPLDALLVINFLNQASGEGESVSDNPTVGFEQVAGTSLDDWKKKLAAVDSYFSR